MKSTTKVLILSLILGTFGSSMVAVASSRALTVESLQSAYSAKKAALELQISDTKKFTDASCINVPSSKTGPILGMPNQRALVEKCYAMNSTIADTKTKEASLDDTYQFMLSALK